MKYFNAIVGALLGLLFVSSAIVVLFKLVAMPPPPEGTPAAHFMAALLPTGYMNFIKVFELLGGVFVAIPRTRNLGLLLLGPVIVNIFAFHTFITGGKTLLDPSLAFIAAASLYLLWLGRDAWLGLARRNETATSSL